MSGIIVGLNIDLFFNALDVGETEKLKKRLKLSGGTKNEANELTGSNRQLDIRTMFGNPSTSR